MSMTSNPTERTEAMEAFYRRNAGKMMTVFGSAFNEAGTKRHEFNGCPDSHEMSAYVAQGTGAAGIEYTKMMDFFASHRGHPMTHLGSMISTKGSMDAWYCQKDDKVCYDTVTG